MPSPVYVIGAGPGGLAVAAALQERGARAVVLERSPAVAASWRGHYDRLHLHTPRGLSGLPGLPIPRRHGRWVSRDGVIDYLEEYVAHHHLEVRPGVDVQRVDSDGDGWVLRTSAGDLPASTVVVATGYNHTPVEPSWPGLDTFTGDVIHASRYRNATPYAGRDVLVVGPGNTGSEIAVDLVEGGARQVWLAVRTAPHIVRRTTAGWPAQGTGILVRRLPVPLVDRLARGMAMVSVPDLSDYGLPRPDRGLLSRSLEGAIPVQDVGIIAAVQARTVTPVAAVAACDEGDVVLADGTRLTPDVVIAATGYSRGLGPLVGHLGVLDSRGRPVAHGGSTPPSAPGLYFTGYTNPISGMFRELRIDARKIARAVTGHR
jgi:putative flavoprotein involved in K+ transport